MRPRPVSSLQRQEGFANLTSVFTPQRHKLRPQYDRIRGWAAELIDALAGRGECDVIADFSFYYPTTIFLGLMGLPPEHLPRFMLYNPLNAWGRQRDVPQPPASTFRRWYLEHRTKNGERK